MTLPIFDPHNTLESQTLAELLETHVTTLLLPECNQWLEWIRDKKTDDVKLALCHAKNGPVFIDFLAGKKAHRRQFGGGKGQPLVKAMGQKDVNGTTSLPSIIDATAGMGGDSFVLASLGFKVTMLERSQIVSALLADALKRAKNALDNQPEDVQLSIRNLSLIQADSAVYLQQAEVDVDVIYMDPMYPEKKKKAAAKKEMQALQTLVGPDLDSSLLLDSALQNAKMRVVIKRPKGAPIVKSSINNIEPTTHKAKPNCW